MNTKETKSEYSIHTGAGNLPRLALVAQDGARAEVYLYGAHITSWVPAGGHERLFLSQVSEFRPGAPVRGGIPVVFPQFGTMGPLPLHGFARLMEWEYAGCQDLGDRASAMFRLRDNEASRSLWPHAFLAELSISVGGNRMEVKLAVVNSGSESFTFTTAFHTYLQVSGITGTCVKGLAGLRYRDAAAGGVERYEENQQVDFAGEVNRIYFSAPAEACLIEPGRSTVIRKTGFTDTVVWNPAAVKCATMPDLEPGAYRSFVCVEAATVDVPVHLAPNECWTGTQALEG